MTLPRLILKIVLTLGLMGTTLVMASGTISTLSVHNFALAIARAEGFGVRGTIPTRYHNPGDIRAHAGVHYPGQVGLNRHGYVIFANDASGWAAFEKILARVYGDSRFYSGDMTLIQFGRRYATSPLWVRNVSRTLRVSPRVLLCDLLDPPIVTMPDKGLGDILTIHPTIPSLYDEKELMHDLYEEDNSDPLRAQEVA
jgi:hypothetical protein